MLHSKVAIRKSWTEWASYIGYINRSNTFRRAAGQLWSVQWHLDIEHWWHQFPRDCRHTCTVISPPLSDSQFSDSCQYQYSIYTLFSGKCLRRWCPWQVETSSSLWNRRPSGSRRVPQTGSSRQGSCFSCSGLRENCHRESVVCDLDVLITISVVERCRKNNALEMTRCLFPTILHIEIWFGTRWTKNH